MLAELQVATVRAQPTVHMIPAFSTGVFVAENGLVASLGDMLDQLTAWSAGMQNVREMKSNLAFARR